MRLLVAFLFVVAGVCVNANPFHRYGWEDGMEYVFRYESQVLTGIPDIRKEQAGGVKLVSNVKVQSLADYTLRIKFEDPKLVSFNEVIVPQTESGRVLLEGLLSGKVTRGDEENELPSEFRHFLMTPYMVRVKGGKIESFLVSQREPVGITNIKRAFLTQIYMDMSGYVNAGIESQQVGESLGRTEQILKQELSGHKRSSDGLREFVTYEEAIQGECKTIYSLTEVPPFKVEEIEEEWKLEKSRYAGEHLESVQGERFCEGKRWYKLTKTRDFNKCKVRPFYQKWIGMDGDCDMSKSSCGSVFSHMARASYYICGSLTDFTIRKMVMDDEKVVYPLSYRTDEKLKSRSRSILELLVKKPFSTPMPLPTETRVERSLVYLFPSQERWESEHLGGLREKVVRQTKEMYGFVPILPMPSLKEAPRSLVPRTLPEEEIVKKAAEVIRRISHLIYETPESCSSKEDVVGLMMTVVKHMRHLSLEHLKNLESMVGESHKQVFYEILCKVGTNPSVVLFIERLREGRFNGLKQSEIFHLVQGTIRNVRTPTPELMRELMKIVKQESMIAQGRGSSSLLTMIIMQISNLFYNAYIHPTNMYTKYPVRIYGVFGTNRSEVITSEYIPFLETLVSKFPNDDSTDEIENEKIGLAAVVALGKLGHMMSLRKLVEVVEGRYNKQPYFRALAVYSMKRLSKRNPSEVKALLMPIIMNPAEHDQVRIAAISVLAYAQPTTAQLQKLVMLTWEDKLSKQVVAFIDSTLENLAHSPVPELINTGRKAAAVRHLMKPSTLGLQYSHNYHSETLIDYLNAIFSEKVHVVNTRNGLLPTRVAVSKDLIGTFGAWKVKGPAFTAYIQGMDRIIDEFLYIMGQTDKVSEDVKEQLQKVAEELRINKKSEYSPRTFILTRMFGFESAYLFDVKSIMETLERASVSLTSSDNIRKEFKLFRAYKIVEDDTLGVTLMGLPYIFQSTSSAIVTTNGTFETSVESGLKAKVKVFPIVNFKTQIDSGVLIPFTQKFVGASVEVGVHSSLAFEVEGKLERNELKLAVKVPEERYRDQTETLHGFVLPYTVIDSYVAMRPTTLAHLKKPILSGLPKKVVEKQVFPRSMGIFCELKLESDNEYIDFASYYHKIKEHSLLSIMTFPSILVSSLRQTSTRIAFSPSKSETKEFELVLKFGSHKHGGSLSRDVEEVKEAIIRHEMHLLKEALESMTEGSNTHMVHMDAVLKGESGHKTLKAGIVLGYKPLSHHKVKSVLAVDIKPNGALRLNEGEETYGILWESELEMPKIEYRWNLEKLLNQALKMKLDSKIKIGHRSGSETDKEIRVKAEFLKTDEQIKSVRDSVEYKKCEQEIQEGKLLSPICMKVRHEAASLNKVLLSVEVPRHLSELRLWKMLEGMVISEYFPLVRSIDGEMYESVKGIEAPTGANKMIVEGHIDRVGLFANAMFKYGQNKYEIKEIPVPKIIGWFMPVSVRNSLYYWILQRLTSNQTPASCRIEPKFIGTFDNFTYPYNINNCGHVLVMDRKSVIPVAVMTRAYPLSNGNHGLEKSVKILAGKFDIELIPTGVSGSGSPLEVKVNERQVNLERGQIYTEKSSKTGKIVFEVQRYMDDVYYVFVVEQGLEVLTNGRYIEVVVPQVFRARSAGLCGDLNGEKTTDLKSPGFCILKAKVAGVAYMLNKEGNSDSKVIPKCDGIPPELKPEYRREVEECVKEWVSPTKLVPILHKLPYLVRPKIASHAVIVARFDICLSRETIDINPRKVNAVKDEVPVYRKPEVLNFVCMPKQSVLAHSLLKRAKAGENLTSVLRRMPLAFKKHIHRDISQIQVPGLEGSLYNVEHQYRNNKNLKYPYLQEEQQYLEEEQALNNGKSSVSSSPLYKSLEQKLEQQLERELELEGYLNSYPRPYYNNRNNYNNNQRYNNSPYSRSQLELEELEQEQDEMERYGNLRSHSNLNHGSYYSNKKAYRNGASWIENEVEEEESYRQIPHRSSSHYSGVSPLME